MTTQTKQQYTLDGTLTVIENPKPTFSDVLLRSIFAWIISYWILLIPASIFGWLIRWYFYISAFSTFLLWILIPKHSLVFKPDKKQIEKPKNEKHPSAIFHTETKDDDNTVGNKSQVHQTPSQILSTVDDKINKRTKIYCPSCGSEQRADARFCGMCGTSIQ